MNDQQVSLLTNDDVYLFNEGTHLRLYDCMGAHQVTAGGRSGVAFAVWAPDAVSVSVIGDFNGWSRGANPLSARGSSGIWEGFVEGMIQGDVYKYHIVSRHDGYTVDKADPFAVFAEQSPKTASRVWNLDYEWGDGEWMASRRERQGCGPRRRVDGRLRGWFRRGCGSRGCRRRAARRGWRSRHRGARTWRPWGRASPPRECGS